MSLLSDRESVGKVDSSRGLKPSRQYNALFWRSRRREIDVFVRLNDLARERLRAHPRVAQRLDLLPKRIALWTTEGAQSGYIRLLIQLGTRFSF